MQRKVGVIQKLEKNIGDIEKGMDKQTNEERERHKDRKTERWRDGEMERRRDREMERRRDGGTERPTDIGRQIKNRQTDRQAEQAADI